MGKLVSVASVGWVSVTPSEFIASPRYQVFQSCVCKSIWISQQFYIQNFLLEKNQARKPWGWDNTFAILLAGIFSGGFKDGIQNFLHSGLHLCSTSVVLSKCLGLQLSQNDLTESMFKDSIQHFLHSGFRLCSSTSLPLGSNLEWEKEKTWPNAWFGWLC